MGKKGRLLRSKKGISPLIATVLLIAFAVALGAVVMNWGRSYVEDMSEKSAETSNTKVACAQDVGYEVYTISNTPKICYDADNGQLEIMLKNTGDIQLYGFTFNVLGMDDTGITMDFNTSINKASFKKFEIEFDTSEHGDIQFVEIIPKIYSAGNVVECSTDADIREDINSC